MRWVRVRGGDLVDGCEDLLERDSTDDRLPWVILFASALGIRNARRRRRRILELADAYRRLFPPALETPGAPSSSGLGP